MTRRSKLPCLLLALAALAGCRSSGPQPVHNALVAEAAPEALRPTGS